MQNNRVHNTKRKRKEKIMPVFSYRRDFEPVGLILITVFRDVVYGFMPPLVHNMKHNNVSTSIKGATDKATHTPTKSLCPKWA